ncbi:TonB-dependent receptor plug domain-containing protein [Paraglaciecola sp.]|uniref:TonB-dependent receptor plug domain-containing protein n=1 Tax=Paraglaciecola sp. TaxID=1920173 RepID=UPI003EF1B566
MKHTPLAVAITLALTAIPTFADTQQNEENTIEKIVVVSSRVAIPLREIATSVSVVTKAEIDARGYSNLTDVLRTEPSISVTNSGGAGSSTSLRVRGEESYRTQVRLDGIDISDPTGTQIGPQLAHLQSSNISRVEILRGSQGLAYGADAGGVVNIKSGQYEDTLAGSLSSEFGRYDTRNLAADLGGENEKLDYYLSASDYKTNGFNSRLNDESQDKDGYQNTTLHTRLGYQVNEGLKLGFVARNTQGDGEYDSCYDSSFNKFNDCDTAFEQSNLRLNANYIINSSEHDIAYTKTLIEREFLTQSISTRLSKGEIQRVEYIGRTNLNDNNDLVYGFDWKEEAITSVLPLDDPNKPFEEQSRTNKGYYFEYQSELITNLFVTAGVRHDDNQDFGEHTSFRLSGAYIWSLGNDELKLRSAYGTGFRAPSLFEVNYNLRPFALPEAAETPLKEEQTKGFEIGVEYTTHNGSQFEAVFFDQKIEDSITYTFDPDTYADGYIQDIGQSESNGLELIADIKLNSAWGVTANYTYNDATDTASNQRRRRPKHIANLGFYFNQNKWTVAANMRLVQSIVDNGPLEDYDLFDLSARYQVNTQLEVYARIENFLDHEYQDISGYNTSGEAAHIGVRYQF